MNTRSILHYGGAPVPYTVSWTAEEAPGLLYLDLCPHAKRIAIRQRHARGQGKPRFGAPHMDRQREVIALSLCDLCAKPLKNRTKVSLSHARPAAHGATFGDVLQVEPLLHKECAVISLQHCPSLKRDVRTGKIIIRQVLRHACQFAVCSEQGTFEATGIRQRSIIHAKVQLVKYRKRDLEWLNPRQAATL